LTPERHPAAPVAPDGRALIRNGAELVHLAEELYVRLFRLVMLLTIAGSALSLWLGGLGPPGGPGVVTFLFAGIGTALAVFGLARPRQLYCWLRYNRAHQLTPTLLAVLAVTLNGAGSPSWWVALPLLWIVADVSSTILAVAAALVTAGAYLATTAATGTPLVSHGNAGILAAAVALPINTGIGRLAAEVFARFVLNLHRVELEQHTEERGEPMRVENLAPTPQREFVVPRVAAPAGRERLRARTSLLTSRQLEVALLARDGLLEGEIAACLGISVRQVERLLHDARERSGAATTSELVALLVTGRLAPAL
jgi:DNA-binding CsgD family transcriptional regulator